MNIEYAISKRVETAEEAISIMDELLDLGVLDSHSLKEGSCIGEVKYKSEHLPAEYGPLPWIPDSVGSDHHLFISWVLGDDLESDSYHLQLLSKIQTEIHQKTEHQFSERVDTQTY